MDLPVEVLKKHHNCWRVSLSLDGLHQIRKDKRARSREFLHRTKGTVQAIQPEIPHVTYRVTSIAPGLPWCIANSSMSLTKKTFKADFAFSRSARLLLANLWKK